MFDTELLSQRDEERIEESALIEAINRVDRFRQHESRTLTENVSALAGIWAVMIYERSVSMPIARLSAKQLAAWQASKQSSLL